MPKTAVLATYMNGGRSMELQSLTNLATISSRNSKPLNTPHNHTTQNHIIKIEDGALGNRPRDRGLRAAKKRQPEPSRPYQNKA